ncbi:MAG: M16 family metallopeptidase [Saprospiraceae bacterium]
MIQYQRFVLPNGLRLIVHEDHSTPMAAVSVQYDVGSRDELPDRTGFAHLFEHLMFSGSKNAPNYDDPLQMAGGENNAFTNNDLTNFYVSLPAKNLETALWLEADRMTDLNINEESLSVQQKVVVEEFKETCLNEPYGDAWHHLSALAYKKHQYRWPTIGLTPDHISEARLEDVRSFYEKYYHAGNAIVVVAGSVTAEEIHRKVMKYFGDQPSGKTPERISIAEATPEAPEHEVVEARVALDSLYMTFAMPDRTHPDFFIIDLLTDVLAEGPSSRLYRRLLKEQELATTIDAYVTGTHDAGLIVVEAKPREGVSLETLEEAILLQLAQLRDKLVPPLELEKVKNKLDSSMAFSELSIVNKAINLAFYEGIGDVELINTEETIYAKVTTEDLQRVAQKYLRPERRKVLFYKSLGEEESV